MSPTPDTGGWGVRRDLWISLTVEQEHGDGLVVRLAVNGLDGRRVVEAELTGDQLARVLAGEAVLVSGGVDVVEQPLDEEEPVIDLDVEPQQPEMREVADVAELQSAGSAVHGTFVDEPPDGTAPIARSIEVAVGEAVVAYVRGRWREVVVVRREIGGVMVAYRPHGGRDVRRRVDASLVRRWL